MADTVEKWNWLAQTINFECYEGTTVVNSETKEGNVAFNAIGGRFLGVATVDLPDITFQTQDMTGSGISGVLKMPSKMLLESLTITLHWRSMSTSVTHLLEQKAHDLALYGAVNRYEPEKGEIGVLPIRIEFRGIPTRTSIGKFAPNEFMDSTSEFEVIVLQITIDGAKVISLSKLHRKMYIQGIDYMEGVGEALGI